MLLCRTWPGPLAALCLAACAHSPRASSPDPELLIRRRLALWVEQFNAGDYRGAATIWAPDLVGWMAGSPDDTFAREQEAASRPAPVTLPQFSLTIEEVMVSGDLAVVRDIWELRNGKQRSVFKSFEVWRGQPDGQWRISRWLNAAPEPSAGPPP